MPAAETVIKTYPSLAANPACPIGNKFGLCKWITERLRNILMVAR